MFSDQQSVSVAVTAIGGMLCRFRYEADVQLYSARFRNEFGVMETRYGTCVADLIERLAKPSVKLPDGIDDAFREGQHAQHPRP